MAKVVGINSDAEGFVRSVKLLIGKTQNDGEWILERPIHKIILLKESEIWFPNEDGNCQDDLTSWGEPVLLQTLCRTDCVKTFEWTSVFPILPQHFWLLSQENFSDLIWTCIRPLDHLKKHLMNVETNGLCPESLKPVYSVVMKICFKVQVWNDRILFVLPFSRLLVLSTINWITSFSKKLCTNWPPTGLSNNYIQIYHWQDVPIIIICIPPKRLPNNYIHICHWWYFPITIYKYSINLTLY